MRFDSNPFSLYRQMGRNIHLDQCELLCAQCHRWQIMDGTIWHNGSGQSPEWLESGYDFQAGRLRLERLAQGRRVYNGQKVSWLTIWLLFSMISMRDFPTQTAKRSYNSFTVNGPNSSRSPITIRMRNIWRRTRINSSAMTRAKAPMNHRCIRRARFYRNWIAWRWPRSGVYQYKMWV